QKTDYFRVYDRYGQLMFETNKWLEGWDGMFKGKKALAGTYVWIIKGVDKNGSVVEMKGTVILVR
ncbi:MAG TPA: gliding motility-associated C-terminal domain-containing protein, partial [Ferruginibacter sp.]|nr:gliding motility-associated C-terminal domain-containing protein [Ferruginibacter sp.]